MKFTWKIGGEAGFGIMTTGLVFSKLATRLGFHIFDYVKYPSLIRGGNNTYEVCVSDEPVHHLKYSVEILICLNKETFDQNKLFLTAESLVVYDEQDFVPESGNYKMVNVPFSQILQKYKGQVVMKNTIALGASFALTGAEITELEKIIKEQFEKKGQAVVDFNLNFAKEGYDYVKQNYSQLIKAYFVTAKAVLPEKQKLVMTGNDAFAYASVVADCRVYVAYPMTPSSSVLTTLAAWQGKTGMVVRHAEDEISVINTAIGSSFAGVRSAVGTSGGGFALMVETVSLAGVTEIPLVIFISQRPGPATGMPTWTEQGDLLFTVNAGHGEFPKIVLAPGDQAEMLALALKAYNLADVYQLPVIVMSDMLLSESHKSVEKLFVNNLFSSFKLDKGKSTNQIPKEKYLRYKITEDGISERLIPGTPGNYYQANSYEHLEDGHTTEEAQPRKDQVDKRSRKNTQYLKNDFLAPQIFGDLKQAQTVFVSWGSSKGAILEAQKLLLEKGNETAFIHFTHLFPLNSQLISPLFTSDKRYILIENNATGQFGKLLRQETGINIENKLLKYDGRPIWPEEIIKYVNNQ